MSRWLSAALMVVYAAAAGGTDRAWSGSILGTSAGAQLFLAFTNPTAVYRLPESMRGLSPDALREFNRRLSLRGAYKPTLAMPPSTAADTDSVVKGARANLEGGIVGLLGRSELRSEAAAFASTVPLSYEWEGYPEGPLAEGDFASDYLRQHPATEMKPFLLVFELYRYRAGFEAAVFSEDDVSYPKATDAQRRDRKQKYQNIQADAARKYVATWRSLQSTTDVVVRAVADEIDGTPRVYIAVALHPRTFGGGGVTAR